MMPAHHDFMLNENTFWTAENMLGYRPGICHSSFGNQHILKAKCSNTVVNIPNAAPVTEHKKLRKCNNLHIKNIFNKFFVMLCSFLYY